MRRHGEINADLRFCLCLLKAQGWWFSVAFHVYEDSFSEMFLNVASRVYRTAAKAT